MGKCVSRLRNCIVAGQKHTASLETCELLSNVLALAIRLPILIFSSFPDTFIGVLRLILPMRTTGAHQYPRDLASSQDDLPRLGGPSVTQDGATPGAPITIIGVRSPTGAKPPDDTQLGLAERFFTS